MVEREVTEPDTQDDQVMGQPAEAEEDSYNDDHPCDLALSLLGLRHVFNGVHRCPEVTDGPHVGEA